MGHRDPGAGGQGLKLSTSPPWHAVTVSANATAAGLSASHRRTAQPVASGGSEAIGTSRSAGWAVAWRPGSWGTTAGPTPSSASSSAVSQSATLVVLGGGTGPAFPVAEVTVEAHTGRGVLREPDVPDTGQLLGLDPLPVGERVVGAYGEHPRQADHRMLLDAGDRRAEGDPGQLRIAVRDGLEAAAAGTLGPELQVDVRMAGAEGDHRLGHEVPDGCGAGGHPDRAAVVSAQIGQPAQRQIQAADAVRRRAVQDQARLGRCHTARPALQQIDARLPFEAFDALADGRLGAAEIAGDGAEAARLAYGDEGTQIIDGHPRTVALNPSYY